MDMEEMEDELGLGLSPGFNFDPDEDELVEQYLLRRILGQQLPLEGVIIDDDPRSAPPWTLLKKHKREDDAFFFADGQTTHGKGNRQKRTCGKDGTWEGQKIRSGSLRVDGSGTEITWKKYMLNFHRTGKKGSTGWVMHEYSITAPEDLASSSLRLYHITLSGHGENSSLRVGDDGGAQARTDEQHISAASSVFPTVAAVDLVDDEDGSRAGPAPASYQYQQSEADSFQDPVVPGSLFFPGGPVGDYAGPTSQQYFMGGNAMNLGATPSSDQGVPGMMNEYDGAPPAAGMLPFCQGSFSGAMDDLSFMDYELPDQQQDFNIDEFLAFPDQPCGLEAPLRGHYPSAGMQTQSWTQGIWPHDR